MLESHALAVACRVMPSRRWPIVVVAVAVALAGPAARADGALPTWPEPTVKAGELPLKGLFPSTVHWLAGDGTPITFQAVLQHGAHDRIVLRAATPAGQQDLVTSDLANAELSVFDHEGGTSVGLQLHDYRPHPNRYEGWLVRWDGKALHVVRTTRFNGYQPQPAWLIDDVRIPDRERVRHAMQTLRWGAHTADDNAFAHFFDRHPVTVTWRSTAPDGKRTARVETVDGMALLGELEHGGLPLVGHRATCKALCCTSDTAPLARWRRIERVCFDGQPTDLLAFPHVRSIEIALP